MTLWILISFMLVGPPVPLEPAIPVRLSLQDGRAMQGEAIEWSQEGFKMEGALGSILWASVRPSDRFRIWRQFLRSSDHDTLEGWSMMATALLVLGDDPRIATRAMERVRSLAGRENAAAVEAEILGDVQRQQLALAAEETARRDEQLKLAPPYRVVQRGQDWPARVAMEQTQEAENVRAMVEAMVDGLNVRPAQSAAFVVFGPGETRVNALRALELDEAHASFAKFLGAENQVNLFPGVCAVILLPDYATMRLLAAEQFQFAVGADAKAVLFYKGDTPVVLGVESSDHSDVAREVALAILHAHRSARGLELWFEAGLSEFVAETTTKGSSIDSQRRGRGLVALRGNATETDGEDYSPEGLSRDLAYLFVTRLIETNPVGVSRLIHRVKSGTKFEAAFRETFGMSSSDYVADCRRWFTLND